MIHGDRYDHTFPYEHSVDIWGLGAVLYHLLSGQPPFTAKHDPSGEEMLWVVMRQPVDWERLRMVGVSSIGVEFLSRMLVTDASERAPNAELLDHEWIRAAETPADASDSVLNAHTSQLSIGDGTEDPRASKRARTWVPDMTRNVWGETASMVVRNQQRENRIEQLPLDMNFPPPPISAPKIGSQPQPNRLFGEIGTSALASSGALGLEGNRALQVQGSCPGSYEISSDDDSRAGRLAGASAANASHVDFQQNNNQGTTQKHPRRSNRLTGPTNSEGAPSLFGTEALVGRLNMASTGSGPATRAGSVNPATPDDHNSTSSHPESKALESGGASKQSKTAGSERQSSEQSHASINYPKLKTMSPVSKAGSRGSDPAGIQDGQESHGAWKSTHDLIATNSRETSQHFGAEDDVIMRDDEDSDDEVSRLEEALAAAKAKKAAKAASRATSRPSSRPISQASSRPASSHAEPTSTVHPSVISSAIFDAGADLDLKDTASFVKPPLRFGNLLPTRGSIHTPAIYITERMTTYGRKPDSTFVHPDPREDRIPKQALDIQMWYPGIETDIDAGSTDWINHPKLEAVLSTRASIHVLVNGVKLKKGKGEYLWGRLRTGDEITVVEPKPGAISPREKEHLIFRCEFFLGLSKNVRKPGDKPFAVEIEQDKFKMAEDRKSRESTASLLSADAGNKGKGRAYEPSTTTATAKS